MQEGNETLGGDTGFEQGKEFKMELSGLLFDGSLEIKTPSFHRKFSISQVPLIAILGILKIQ